MNEVEPALDADETTLVDVLDSALATGVVAEGDLLLSVADVDLVHLGLRLVLRGIEGNETEGVPLTGRRAASSRPAVEATPRPPRRRPATGPAKEGGGEDEDTGAGADAGATIVDALDRLVDAGQRGDLDPAGAQRGLAALVLTVVQLLQDLMERQALRRMRSGSLDDDEIERLGRTFQALRARTKELQEVFDLTDDDLRLDLGPLGRLR